MQVMWKSQMHPARLALNFAIYIYYIVHKIRTDKIAVFLSNYEINLKGFSTYDQGVPLFIELPVRFTLYVFFLTNLSAQKNLRMYAKKNKEGS